MHNLIFFFFNLFLVLRLLSVLKRILNDTLSAAESRNSFIRL